MHLLAIYCRDLIGLYKRAETNYFYHQSIMYRSGNFVYQFIANCLIPENLNPINPHLKCLKMPIS